MSVFFCFTSINFLNFYAGESIGRSFCLWHLHRATETRENGIWTEISNYGQHCILKCYSNISTLTFILFIFGGIFLFLLLLIVAGNVEAVNRPFWWNVYQEVWCVCLLLPILWHYLQYCDLKKIIPKKKCPFMLKFYLNFSSFFWGMMLYWF